MPNTNSARKSLRVGERRNAENRKVKMNIRQVMKKASTETLSEVFSTLDKAAKNHVIHENKAARLKSRVSAKVAKVEEPKAEKKAATKKTTTKKTTTAKKTTAKK